MYTLAVFDVRARLHGNNIGQAHTQVIPDDPIHAYLLIGTCVIGENDTDGLLPPLALEQHRITSEELQLVHLVLGERDDGVVIVDGFLDQETVGLVLASKDRSRQIVRAGNIARSHCHGTLLVTQC